MNDRITAANRKARTRKRSRVIIPAFTWKVLRKPMMIFEPWRPETYQEGHTINKDASLKVYMCEYKSSLLHFLRKAMSKPIETHDK